MRESSKQNRKKKNISNVTSTEFVNGTNYPIRTITAESETERLIRFKHTTISIPNYVRPCKQSSLHTATATVLTDSAYYNLYLYMMLLRLAD